MTAHETVGESRQPPAGKITYEEFLAWCDEDTLAEWVRGKVQMRLPAALPHQQIIRFLSILLSFWVRDRGLGGAVLLPFQMKLAAPVDSGRGPDLSCVAQDLLD